MGLKDFKVKVYKENILHNYHYLKKIKQKDIIAVVKSNAYGHGIENIVKFLSECGCKYFAVARECEAEKILKLKLNDINIIILETIDELDFIKKNSNVQMVVNSLKDLLNLLNQGVSTKQLHLKLDFGFGRNGIMEKEFDQLVKIVKEKDLNFKGISTHVFAADYEDMLKIEEKFSEILKILKKDRFEMIHMQNSAGVISIEGKNCTHIRCGTILFGLQEIGYFDPNVKRAFKLNGKILGIKDLKDLKYIGYEKKENINIEKYKKIAKIRLGYGDGFSKRSEGIMSIINNKKFKIVHISMDSSFILVDDSVKEGDFVEIFHDLEDAINHLKVPHYEFLSCINDRIKRELI
ncbi:MULTISPECIES: alanine racemase [Cetobacterium]|jgi:alanine racemase|uniref:Alanine racemase n=1 Tax=Candidatus Cetobacterium colombiensis TaxID=3073100 RepID=A0ABU4WE31_9FUSO|nr:alanine racemase [Candidatus Cetobacterium colombiensis]MDX8336758.1 alanine racemase [Candidatus Cetobacterium colombiensis]